MSDTVDFEAVCADLTDDNSAICSLYDSTTAMSDQVEGLADGVNVFFLLFAGTLVFFMQAGFAMFCASSVRQKNVKNIMLKNLLNACGGALGFWTVGNAFACTCHLQLTR